MRSKSRYLLTVASVIATIVLTHSCFRQDGRRGGGVPKIDRAQLCLDGGATVDEKTNECVCAAGLVWTGVRCDVDRSILGQQESSVRSVKDEPQKVPDPPPSAAPAVKESQASAEEPSVEVTDKIMRRTKPAKPQTQAEERSTASQEPQWMSSLIRACRIAGGSWLARHKYCHCPDGKVLMGRRCRLTGGRMTDDVCLRAVNKGKWKGGICECPKGLVFSPGRGGCVEPFAGDDVIMRRICENTVNQGKWIQRHGRCRCPDDHILVDETCVRKTYLRSEDICESFENGGTWNSAAKRCSCPAGKTWINQSCS